MEDKEMEKGESRLLSYISGPRILMPIGLGVAVVSYLLWKQFDVHEFNKISFSKALVAGVFMSIFFMIIRHLFYALRLRILTKGYFSWKKCIELIFIWEFSSAVSPTSVGGSAVALFVLSQENLSAGKTAALIIYTVIMDTLFFFLSIPLLFLLLGPSILGPEVVSFSTIGALGTTLVTGFIIMMAYGLLFFYGVIVNPLQTGKIISWFTRLPLLKRFERSGIQLTEDLKLASTEIKAQPMSYHLGVFVSTAGAWICRFLLLSSLIYAFVPALQTINFMDQLMLYARQNTMYIIMAISPTPGGAGITEVVFGKFLSDFVPEGISIIIALIWRIMTYWLYLFAGVVIVPNWLRARIKERKLSKRNLL